MKLCIFSLLAASWTATQAFKIPNVFPEIRHNFRHNFGHATTDVTAAGVHVSELKASQEGEDLFNLVQTLEAFISPFIPKSATGSFEITHFYRSAHNGLIHIFTRQVINGIPVMNGLGQLNMDNNNNIISSSDSFWNGEVPVVESKPMPKAKAVIKFLKAMGEGGPPVTNAPDENAEQMWVVNGKEIKLSWIFEVQIGDFDHVLEVAIDAGNGHILQCLDLVVGDEDLFEENEGSGRKLAQTTESAKYRGWGVPNMTPDLGDSELHIDPQVPEASPLGWHAISSSQTFRDTRGNNVFAQENSRNEAGFPPENGYRPESKSAGIDFDFDMNFNNDPADGENLDATITNLFLMNNIMHDLLYTYGFDEGSGNFQINNFEKGGNGNDAVVANSLDGSGTNNANMYTPADGFAPRMRMYRWNFSPGEDKPSSLDGTVVAHEYVHGLSNRLTGGPQNSGCLSSLDAGGMGEGWSDYVGIMMSINEASQFEESHGVGGWLVGGVGIRRYPYTTDMSVNPLTFDDINIARSMGVHAIGTIWASILYDMSANLVADFGFNEDIYQCQNCSAENQGGNKVALQLVIDGMKLQPCNPSFIDARDAILMADEVDYEGVHQCSIWRSFARRGLGIFASDTSVASESFCVPDECQTSDTSDCTSAPTPAPFSDQDLGQLDLGEVFVQGSTEGRSDTYGNPASDVRIFFALPKLDELLNLEISLCSPITQYDTYIWLLDSNGNLVASNDDSRSCGSNELSSYLDLSVGRISNATLRSGEDYILVIDGYANSSGEFGLNLSLEIQVPTFPPSRPPSVPPTFPDDDESESVCYAVRILADEIGIENLCENILDLDIEYQCGVAETTFPTFFPTYQPTFFPTADPTAMPTVVPTVVPTKSTNSETNSISVELKCADNQRFTTDKPLYMILVGEKRESSSLNLGLMTARAIHNIELTVEAEDVGELRAVRFCLDENEPDRTRLSRSNFNLYKDGQRYALERRNRNMPVLLPGRCHEENVIMV